MANYVVKIYNQTGFDSCNVPDSSRMIANNFTPYKEYTTFELVQGRYLSSLRVQLTAKEANKIDLVTLSSDEIYDTTVYTVDGYTMQAPDVCEFKLLLEPYSTLGGFGYDSGNWVLNGTMKRCHVSVEDDNKNFYTLPEPFENREPIEWSVSRLTPSSGYKQLIETMSVPTQIIANPALARAIKDSKIKGNFITDFIMSKAASIYGSFLGYDSSNKEAYTYQYMETTVARTLNSTILTPDPDNTNIKVTLGTRWWDASKINYDLEVQKIPDDGTTPITDHVYGSLTSDLVSDGRGSDVLAIWEVPEIFVTLSAGSGSIDYKPNENINYGGFDTANAYKRMGNITLTKWSQTTYNNKLNYGQDLMIKVYNPASGSSVEHQVTEIMSPNSAAEWISSVPYTLKADVRPTGNPIFMFNYINKADNITNMIEVVNGGNWRQINLTDIGTTSKIAEQLQNYRNEQYSYNQMAESIDSLTGALRTVLFSDFNGKAGAMGMGVGVASNIMTNQRDLWRNTVANQQQNHELMTKAATASVRLSREATSYANDCDKNGFFAIVSHFSNHDLQAFDTFLTRYGYNVGNMPFDGDQTYFYNRPSYNFVQVNDMTVESVTGNVNLVNDCIERLKQGLRIWHVKPNAKDMLAGGNR